MPNEKPILFSTPMVQAILAGRKTMTRRVIKPQPDGGHTAEYNYDLDDGSFDITCGKIGPGGCADWTETRKPAYREGDILWVRETWGNYAMDCPESHSVGAMYRADYPRDATGYWYEDEHINWCDFPKWRPSIFMPKEACRIFLRVLAVRPERLQEISKGEAMMEGIDFAQDDQDGKEQFAALWDSINAARGHGWDANPWVWAITFERCKKPMGWPGN